MPLADIGERLQRALEIVAGREQWLRDIGARPRNNGDPTATRAFVNEPCRAGRTFAIDNDLGHVIAQFDRQIETGVNDRFGAEIKSRAPDFTPLNVKGAHCAGRWRVRIRSREPGGQRSRLIVRAGKRERAPAVGHDFHRLGDRRKPG